MRKLFQGSEALLEDDSFRGNGTTGGVFLFLKLIKDLLTLFPSTIGEEERAVSLEVISNSVGIRFIRGLLIMSECNCDDFIFAHEKLGISECFAEGFEVVGAHVVKGEHIEELVLVEEGMHLVHNELFVFAHLGLHFSQRHYLVLLCDGHQQSIII